MTTAEHKSDSDDVIKQAVELLSENDCIVLRKSRKTSWYKPQVFRVYSNNSKNLKNIEDENIFIDSGKRSRERPKIRSCQINQKDKQNVITARTAPIRKTFSKERFKCEVKTGRKKDNINLSIDSMGHMLKLAILEKSDILLDSLVVQLRGLDEERKNKVLDKLGFEDRMLVIKSLYFRKYEKPPFITKKRITSPVYSRSCQRQASSLTRELESPKSPRKSFRKSFSFLVADTVDNPIKTNETNAFYNENYSADISTKNSIPKLPKNDNVLKGHNSSKILIQQIYHLQNQNAQLTTKIRHLISNNFNLEHKLEELQRINLKNVKAYSQMKSFTKCHDDIIDNVYNAYVHLTKSLRNLKFNRMHSASTNNLTVDKHDITKYLGSSRSRSMDATEHCIPYTKDSFSKCHSVDSVNHVENFLKDRKESLNNEINHVNQQLKTIKNTLGGESIASTTYKKNIEEKNILEQQLFTLERMLKSLEEGKV